MAGKRTDDLISGTDATTWIKIIGKFGDQIRQSSVNPIVLYMADELARSPLSQIKVRPENFIQRALKKFDKALDGYSEQDLERWHEDSVKIAELYPGVSSAHVWDLGCGEGYLGRWLSGQGVTYVGTEPSEELYRQAQKNKRPKTQYRNKTATAFLKSPPDERPTLITMIASLEMCADPLDTLRQINSFLLKGDLTNVPILLTTFDPDYFFPGRPTCGELLVSPRIMGGAKPMKIQDPAAWEQIFNDLDYRVIDQRPVNLAAIPPQLANYIAELCKKEVRHGDPLLSAIPPSRGPFHFWLITARTTRLAASAKSMSAVDTKVGGVLQEFADGQTIETAGSLGSKIHYLHEGKAYFNCRPVLEMQFKPGQFFGQMEISRNYFAARVLGPITAAGKTIAQTLAITDARNLIGDDLTSQLFRSMIDHEDSTRYRGFINSKQVRAEQTSDCFIKAPLTGIQNCAAVLLNACANKAVRGQDYLSRTMICISLADIQSAIYRDVRRRAEDLGKFLDYFVQAGIVDCFSSRLLDSAGAYEKLQKAPADSDLDVLHIGVISARFIESAFRGYGEIDFDFVAAAISTMLGSERDKTRLKGHIAEIMEAEERNRETKQIQARAEGARESSARLTAPPVRSSEDIHRLILKHVHDSTQDVPAGLIGSLGVLLDRLQDNFSLKNNASYHNRGFCDYVMVRDTWALLACVMDNGKMWNSNIEPVQYDHWYAQKNGRGAEHRNRFIAFRHDCVGHIACECKLL